MALTNKLTILDTADALFSAEGVREVSIDDICRKLGISKKTFYQYYPQKEDLIVDVLDSRVEKKDEAFLRRAEGKNTVELMVLLSELVSKKKTVDKDKIMVRDIAKYYPETFQKFAIEKKKHIRKYFEDALSKGKEEGSIRPDIDADSFSLLFCLLHESMIDYMEDKIPTDGKKISFKQLTQTFEDIFTRALLTAEGLKEFESLNKNNLQ